MTTERQRKALEFLAVSAVVALAAALRLKAASLRGGWLGWDEVMYITLGRNFLSGQGYQLFGLPNVTFAPVVPVISGTVYLLTGSSRWALSAPSAFFGALAAVPIFLLAGRMFSRKAAWAAIIIYAGLRPLLVFSPFCPYIQRLYAGSEHIYIFFVAWTLYFAWRAWEEKGVLFACLAGLFCGLAFETRQEALVLLVALAGALAISAALRKTLSLKLAARLGCLVGCFAVAAAPFLIYARLVTGHFLVGPNISHNVTVREAFKSVVKKDDWKPYFRLHHELNEDSTEFKSAYYGVAAYHRQAAADYSHLRTFGRLFGGMDFASLPMWLANLASLLPWYAWLAVFAGLFGGPLRQCLERVLFTLATLAPGAAIALMLLVLARYDIYWMAPAAVLAGGGLAAVADSLARLAGKWTSLAAVSLAVIISVPGSWQALSFDARTRADDTFRERHMELMTPALAEEIRKAAPEGGRVLCHDPQACLEAGVVWVPLPVASLEDIAAFANAKGARIVVLKDSDTAWSAEKREKTIRAFMFNEALERQDLFRIAYEGVIQGERVAILEVIAQEPLQGGVE